VCGRYSNTVGPEELGRQVAGPLGVKISERTAAELPRYNIAPRDPVLGIVSADGVPEARVLQWGLVPAWAREVPKKPYINATVERLRETGEFLQVSPDPAHRVLLVADEFMEWAKAEQPRKVKPAPFGFQVDGGQAFCFAGLWSTNNNRLEGDPLATCTIVTCSSAGNPVIASIHERSPVILPDPEQWQAWLDPEVSAQEALSFCRVLDPARMSARPLPLAFNNARNKHRQELFDAPQPPASLF
jgi:putative SOS response-associated peptidase YedK